MSRDAQDEDEIDLLWVIAALFFFKICEEKTEGTGAGIALRKSRKSRQAKRKMGCE